MDEIRIEKVEVVSGPSERRNFERGLRAGFIDASEQVAERYRPRLIANDESTGTNLLSVIKRQLSECDRFDICVAFVSEGGLQPLVEILAELKRRGVRGRFLTSTFNNFNTPNVFAKLLEYENIEVRVYQGPLHAKGYVFDRDDTSTVIIGSSNLTQYALTCNREWNVLFRSYGAGEMLQSLRSEYEDLWNSELTVSLTSSWVSDYRKYRPVSEGRQAKADFRQGSALEVEYDGEIRPNGMQVQALEALSKLHERKEPRALLVSATGTGKTYLSAFDVAATKPRRVLFLAHRQRILDASRKSYKRLLGKEYSCGQYNSGSGDTGERCLFAMCSTIYYPWYSEKTGTDEEKYWDIKYYGTSPAAYSDDMGVMMFRSVNADMGESERFYSPVFDVSGLLHPAVLLKMYHTTGASDQDCLQIEASGNGSEWKEAGEAIVVGGAAVVDWQDHVVPLDEFAGCDSLVFAMKGISAQGSNIIVDNVSLIDNCYDMGITQVAADGSADPDKDFTITVAVENCGAKLIDSYKVELSRDGGESQQAASEAALAMWCILPALCASKTRNRPMMYRKRRLRFISPSSL